MTSNVAARLAARLMELHAECDRLDFELDTPENAQVLAQQFEQMGHEVLQSSYGARISIRFSECPR